MKTVKGRLAKNLKDLENCTSNNKIINLKNSAVRKLLKLLIATDAIIPFALACFLLLDGETKKGRTPFITDTVEERSGIEVIDTSTGNHMENESNFYFNNSLIEYSTAWELNDMNIYERTVYYYDINDKIDLNNPEEILCYTKEELEGILHLSKVQTICKDILEPKDKLYDFDVLIVANERKDETYIERPETFKENFYSTIAFLIAAGLISVPIKILKDSITEVPVGEKLKSYLPNYKKMTIEELSELKKILELQKDNLELLNDDTSSKDFKLRKVKNYE